MTSNRMCGSGAEGNQKGSVTCGRQSANDGLRRPKRFSGPLFHVKSINASEVSGGSLVQTGYVMHHWRRSAVKCISAIPKCCVLFHHEGLRSAPGSGLATVPTHTSVVLPQPRRRLCERWHSRRRAEERKQQRASGRHGQYFSNCGVVPQ